MTMKLGCATFSYVYVSPFEETLRRLAEVGFKDIEVSVGPPHIWPPDVDASGRAKMLRVFDKHGVRPSLINRRFNDLNIASINPGVRAETIREMKDDIDLAADLGAPYMMIVPGKPTPLFSPPPEEIWRLAREGVEQCVEHASRKGVTCLLENVGYSLCHVGGELRRMAEEINSEHCRVHYDVANANLYESPTDAIREIGPWLGCVHLSDNDGKVWSHSPIGEGNIDFAGVFEALKDVSFSGPSFLEINVYESQDEVMRSGLARLKELGWQP